MMILKPVTPTMADPLRKIRLRALQDSPWAFGSTYDREVQFTTADWQQRAARCNGDKTIGYLAFDGDAAQAISVGLLDSDTPVRAELVSMWVAPDYRQGGVGKQLVNAVVDWAIAKQAAALYLMVTSGNAGAIAFYQRLGFVKTGHIAPYPNDSRWVEYEMRRSLSSASKAPP